MSWSVSALGKPEAIAKKLAEDFAKITYLVPEEAAVKDAIADVVAKTLLTQAKGTAVDVSASGSLSTFVKGGKLHSVNLSIKTIYGFVE